MEFKRPVPILTKVLVSAALCFATAPAANAACQPGQNCVLPVAEAPPPPPPAEVAVVEETKEWGIWPILLAAAAVAVIALLLLSDDDDDDEEPVSP
jgi:hypothetical protein